ncbi:MAG: hypothetical protein QNK33_01440, partial [Bacteroidales bacterium]|nr:hypothetical protein [Bacteroidales bacterium]
FTSGGKIVKRIKNTQTTDGYVIQPITWNGYSENGAKVGRGIYVYRVSIRTHNGEKAYLTGRMVIL